MDFIAACRHLISVDSTTEQGSMAMAHATAELCRKAGLEVELQAEFHSDLEEANVIARLPGAGKQNEIMFQNHLDTVGPGIYTQWAKTQCNPFDAHIIDGYIHGLGAADVKCDLLCKLAAISSFAGKKFKHPPVLVGTFGEGSGMMGALRLIRKSKVHAKWAVVAEASNLRLITAGLGYAKVEIRVPFSDAEQHYRVSHDLQESTSSQSKLFSGKAAHSSNPSLGESAIKKMLTYLSQLPEDLAIMQIEGGTTFNTVPAHAFVELDPVSGFKEPMARKLNIIYREILELEDSFLKYPDSDFQPPYPTLNIGTVKTRIDHVYLSGICRITPSISNEIYDQWMMKLHGACQKVGAELRVSDYKKPFRTEETSELVSAAHAALVELGLDPASKSQSSTSEASLFSRVGIECIAFGPGLREGNIHTPNERVSIEDLKTTTAFYRRLIERLCL